MERALITGFFLGIILSSPIGPMGMVCLRRTLTRGPGSGFTSALGISCADAFWAFIVTHGLAVISRWLEQGRTVLEISIALFFILYGLHGIFNPPKICHSTLQKNDNAVGFLSTFLIVFLNPGTFFSFVLMFTLFGITKSHYGLFNSILITAAVFTGSAAFWFTTIQLLHRIRKSINESIYEKTSHISSYLIMVLGIITLLAGLYGNL